MTIMFDVGLILLVSFAAAWEQPPRNNSDHITAVFATPSSPTYSTDSNVAWNGVTRERGTGVIEAVPPPSFASIEAVHKTVPGNTRAAVIAAVSSPPTYVGSSLADESDAEIPNPALIAAASLPTCLADIHVAAEQSNTDSDMQYQNTTGPWRKLLSITSEPTPPIRMLLVQETIGLVLLVEERVVRTAEVKKAKKRRPLNMFKKSKNKVVNAPPNYRSILSGIRFSSGTFVSVKRRLTGHSVEGDIEKLALDKFESGRFTFGDIDWRVDTEGNLLRSEQTFNREECDTLAEKVSARPRNMYGYYIGEISDQD